MPAPEREQPQKGHHTRRTVLGWGAAVTVVAAAGVGGEFLLRRGSRTVEPKATTNSTSSNSSAIPTTSESTQPKPTEVLKPSRGAVTVENGRLVRDGKPFGVYGTNCYPLISNGEWGTPLTPEQRKQEIQTAARQGMNVVRYWDFSELTNNGNDFSTTKELLDLAAKNNVLLYPTLTNQWANGDGSSPAKSPQWYEEVASDFANYKKTGSLQKGGFLEYAQTTARELKGNTNVLAIQGINEAECPNPATLQKVAEALHTIVKAEDPNRLVTIGVQGSGQNGAQGDDFKTLMNYCDFVDFHIYDDKNGTMTNHMLGDQWNGVAVRMQQAKDLNKPVVVSEVGINPANHDLAQFRETIYTLMRDPGFAGLLTWDLITPPFNSNDGDQYSPTDSVGQMYASIASKLRNPDLRPQK